MTILDAFAGKILPSCKQSALGTSVISEIQRFVEILELYKQVADFPICAVFKLSRFEDGLPKSIILQKEKDDATTDHNETQSRLQSIAQSLQRDKSSSMSVTNPLGTALRAAMIKKLTNPQNV